jgi:hypothetical protein
MKPLSLRILTVILISIAFTDCQKTYTVSKSQEVLYQFEYINNSQGYAHSGFFVDVNGNILRYNLPAKWNFPKEGQTLSKQEVLENISASKTTGDKISPEELQKYINYIDNIAASKVTSPKNIAAEAGLSSYYCFQFSENSSTYKRTVIKTEGNSECENLNFFSKKVVVWMNEIRGSISE